MEKKRKNTITRREFIKKSAIAAGTLYGTSLGVLPKRVWADKKNNSVIVGMTQEPAKLNPILYDNSGTEEVPESCMFDALWDILPNGEFTPNLAVKVPTFDNQGIFRRSDLEDRTQKGRQVAGWKAFHCSRRGVHLPGNNQSQKCGAIPDWI